MKIVTAFEINVSNRLKLFSSRVCSLRFRNCVPTVLKMRIVALHSMIIKLMVPVITQATNYQGD